MNIEGNEPSNKSKTQIINEYNFDEYIIDRKR